MNMNTVAPRIASTRVALKRRSQEGTYSNDVNLVINLSESTDKLRTSLTAMEVHVDTLRTRHPKYRRWEHDLADQVLNWVNEHLDDPADSDAKLKNGVVIESEPDLERYLCALDAFGEVAAGRQCRYRATSSRLRCTAKISPKPAVGDVLPAQQGCK